MSPTAAVRVASLELCKLLNLGEKDLALNGVDLELVNSETNAHTTTSRIQTNQQPTYLSQRLHSLILLMVKTKKQTEVDSDDPDYVEW